MSFGNDRRNHLELKYQNIYEKLLESKRVPFVFLL